MLHSVLISRSSLECHLYIELHPCPCGERRFSSVHKLLSADEGLLAVYEGTCPKCSIRRRFEFLLDPELPPGNKFGGIRLSTIVDAGQYLAVAEEAAKQVTADIARLGASEKREARDWMNRAINALEEVLKWIPPHHDAVPFEALFTSSGKAIYQNEPGRFRRLRLEAVLDTYRKLLAELR